MEELRKGFHHELDEVRLSLARLAASVIEAIPRATNVLLSGDLEGAEYLILADDEIDSRSIALEDRCYQLLALQAPVAGDLRQLISILKMVGEIERSADLTVNIAKAARRIYGHSLQSCAASSPKWESKHSNCLPLLCSLLKRTMLLLLAPLTIWTRISTACNANLCRQFLKVMPQEISICKWLFS
jgi:hypothetical protein